jgi:hypothetical protein
VDSVVGAAAAADGRAALAAAAAARECILTDRRRVNGHESSCGHREVKGI